MCVLAGGVGVGGMFSVLCENGAGFLCVHNSPIEGPHNIMYEWQGSIITLLKKQR